MRWFWVDRFTEYAAGSHAVGVKGVSLADDHMHDHWDVYPVMPNSLIAEGMAQTAGLLVSELYDFQELVVLAKFTKLAFSGLARPGDSLVYRAEIGRRVDVGAQCTVTAHIGDRQQAEAEIFFARLAKGEGAEASETGRDERGLPARLFDPVDLVRWLHTTDVFRVGLRTDGTPMKPEQYGLPTLCTSA
ncbi:3-hydroxyacyl-[acyl-carrier-protein] dehydratase FabZ [Pseudobythopirellula maris]|uniref:3-hydroxyacyl-[acyl-carrier-protein] dehydratase FabZ n=1 Tax=Pseudobythopirellula maris TaxID=2527991 RepID=A0A5C5ZRU4_9BACT|nr:beta-hydroxyacyl-ACP dehydratase [Pseudobythopirellula maris]TWT88943.1 3-hydroxyacyl-[acyl-carrier-protein] dehydratase FabZ [Pseudobythopirellula maris]